MNELTKEMLSDLENGKLPETVISPNMDGTYYIQFTKYYREENGKVQRCDVVIPAATLRYDNTYSGIDENDRFWSIFLPSEDDKK